jgi:hypothetical protein
MRITYNTLSKTLAVLALLTLIGLGLFSWTGADKHMTTLVEGDYIAAQKQFLEAAEQGDATAQYNLALMYDSGKDIPQDDAEALRWYNKAAEQGHSAAQYNLSMVYLFGKGVTQDTVAAYKWIVIANAHAEDFDDDHIKDAKPKLAEKMSPEQIATAQEAAQRWLEKYRK